MIIGTITELKEDEFRVGLVPSHVKKLVEANHTVLVEKGAGEGSGFSDQHYKESGAIIVDNVFDIYQQADMIVKVKEPIPIEYDRLKEDSILMTYLHLAADKELGQVLLDKKITAIGYETIELENGFLPCLKPMSEIAGYQAVLEGIKYLQRQYGGKGRVMSPLLGQKPGTLLIVGSGNVGRNAMLAGLKLRANVIVYGNRLSQLQTIKDMHPEVLVVDANKEAIDDYLKNVDICVLSALVVGETAPHIITRNHLKTMEKGTVLVDVSVDQGGCAETTRPTTHAHPTYVEEGIVHYCVANIPGSVPYTASVALNDTTIEYILAIANKGLKCAVIEDEALFKGINTIKGQVAHQGVANAFEMAFVDAHDYL